MKERYISILCITVVLCMGISITSESASRKLVVWAIGSTDSSTNYQPYVDGFMRHNPDVNVAIEVQSVSQTAFMEKLAVAIASNSAPDLAWISGGAVKEFALQGLLVDVTKALDGVEFVPGTREEMSFMKSIYSTPVFSTIRGLFKSVDMLNSAGINPYSDPKDLDDLWIWNKKLTKISAEGKIERAGILPWSGNWYPPAWMWAFGGRLVDETGLHPTANEPANVKAFTWLKEWVQAIGGNPNPVQGSWEGLVNGTVAMTPGSATQIKNMNAANVPYTTGRVPHPPGGRNGSWGGTDGVGIPINARNKADAMLLLQYFANQDAQLVAWETLGTLPSNMNTMMRIMPRLTTQQQTLLAQLQDVIQDNNRCMLFQPYLNALNAAQSQVFAGRTTPEQALIDVQATMTNLFEGLIAKLKTKQ